jgi:hypothetical protein
VQEPTFDRQRLGTFLLGGVAGILAGLILAPRSGRETRGAIFERAAETRERGRERYFETRERVSERFSEARERRPGERRERPEPPVAEPRMTGAAREVPREPDVLRGVPDEEEGGEVFEEQLPSRPEELRRKVRETRERLRERRGGEEDHA